MHVGCGCRSVAWSWQGLIMLSTVRAVGSELDVCMGCAAVLGGLGLSRCRGRGCRIRVC
ncbi:hypothetical protein BJV78DRAFT_1233832 [Lactifluus subvellereus]|nr:hypothetical protein BJV78DRAFT_1233832 [Lactifluus subvellereus]